MKIIFKHSHRCPTSARAKEQVDRFLEDYGNGIDYEFIDVIGNRPRSNQVAEQYGLKHESPQVLIVDDKDAVAWHASHSKITVENLKTATGK